MIPVREATHDDVPRLAAALARAFADDPVAQWILGEGEGLQRRNKTFFAMEAHRHLDGDRVLTTDDVVAGAYWAPPGKWRTPTSHVVRTLPTMIRLMGRRLPRAGRALREIEKRHPSEPHWYLAVLGTDPEHQGKGVGGALLAPVLDECDRDGIGAYLESSKERNVPYYRRFGFEVVDQFDLPNGPPMWLMWREPRPPADDD